MILMLIGLVVGTKCYRLASAFEAPRKDETVAIVRRNLMQAENIPPWLEHAQITQVGGVNLAISSNPKSLVK